MPDRGNAAENTGLSTDWGHVVVFLGGVDSEGTLAVTHDHERNDWASDRATGADGIFEDAKGIAHSPAGNRGLGDFVGKRTEIYARGTEGV